MLYADAIEETLNFDGYQNNEYNWNSDRLGSATHSEIEGDESGLDTSFGDRIARSWRKNWSRSADEILLFKNGEIDFSAYDIAPAEAEKTADIDILTGEAIARIGDGDTGNSAGVQTAIKTATAPDLTRRGRPKRQGEAGSYLRESAPASAPTTSPDSSS
ncbi:MAG: hypothetical protein ACP5D7_01060 [Limnospira sp.]